MVTVEKKRTQAIKGRLRPNRSASVPKSRAPTDRMASVNMRV